MDEKKYILKDLLVNISLKSNIFNYKSNSYKNNYKISIFKYTHSIDPKF